MKPDVFPVHCRDRVAGIILLLTLTTGCASMPAITAFSANTQQISELLPKVAAVPFDACVDLHLNQQLNNPASLPNVRTAEAACPIQAAARDGIAQTYSVLILYMTVLGKVASGSPLPPALSVSSISANAAAIAGANSARKSAVSGLATAIAKLYLHARTQAALQNAIAAADPHVQALCLAFNAEILPELSVTLDAQEEQLHALYLDNPTTGAVRLLMVRQFSTEVSRITANRNLATRYSAVLTELAKAHAKLNGHPGHLRDRQTIADLISSSDAIDAHLRAIHALGK